MYVRIFLKFNIKCNKIRTQKKSRFKSSQKSGIIFKEFTLKYHNVLIGIFFTHDNASKPPLLYLKKKYIKKKNTQPTRRPINGQIKAALYRPSKSYQLLNTPLNSFPDLIRILYY